MRRFCILSLVLGLMLSFVPHTASAACSIPDPDGRVCAVLNLLPSCSGTIATVNANIARNNPSGQPVAVPPGACNAAPALPADQNVVVANKTFNPDATTVVLSHWLYFQNVDNLGHAIADQRCLDDPSKACRWAAVGSPVGGFATNAKGIFIGGNFHTGDVVAYYCAIHTDMKGTFTVA